MQAVHPSGNPMSHSTHVGFRAPVVAPSAWPTTTVNGSVPRLPFGLAAPLIVRLSRATGVGHSLAACARFSPNPFPVWCLPFASVFAFTSSRFASSSSADQFSRVKTTVGVGQSGFKKFRGERPPERMAEAFVLLASGVGNNPEAGAKMGGADVGSSYAIPDSIIPEAGQVFENDSKSSTKERCDVLHEHEAGS